MNRSIGIAISLLALSTSAIAADIDNIITATKVERSQQWSGFYSGINIGGAVSVADGVTSTGYSTSDWAASAEGDPYSMPPSRTGNATVSQSGLIGGGQIGYAWKFNEIALFGFEADFQGATIQGGGSFTSVSGAYYNGHAHRQQGFVDTITGISWLGTARGRLGYLIHPNILLFTTGGLAYGENWANVNTISLHWHPGTEAIHPPVPVSPSYTSARGLNAGWVAGAGSEWGFGKSWSIKVEGLYYDLGSQSVNGQYNFNVNPLAPGYVANVSAATTVAKYQGIIVRSGLNYHMNYDPINALSAAKD